MATVPQESLKRWTISEVLRLVDSGALERPERLELVDGLILEKMGQNEPHAVSVTLTLEALRLVFGKNATVTAGVPLALSATDEPEPDAMVVTPGLRRKARAEDVRLVVEVSESSLRTDRTTKAALYARHGIPEYVILDVARRRVEVRRGPDGEGWRETFVLGEGEAFTPLGASEAIQAADLFGDAE